MGQHDLKTLKNALMLMFKIYVIKAAIFNKHKLKEVFDNPGSSQLHENRDPTPNRQPSV